MDTDALVEAMTSTQQAKIDKQEQKKTRYEWYNEALKDVVDSVKEFNNTYCSALGTSSMLKSSNYSPYNVTSDSASKAVTVTAGNNAEEGNITVMVSQLAVNANVSSSGKVSKDGKSISSSNTATLSSLSFANTLQFDNDGEICFSINGKAFTFKKTDTLQGMINTINSDEEAKVTIKYSRLTDGFSITADSGGSDSKVTIQNITGNAFGANGAFQINTGTVSNGQNSIAEINGTVIEKDSNEYTIDNITYKLNSVTAYGSGSMIVKQLAKNSNTASSGKVSADGTEIAADNTATLAELKLANKLNFDESGNISFSINGKSFSFSGTSTLQNMLDTINNDADANVTLQYSRLKDKFIITADSGGEDSKITIINNSGNAFGDNSAFQIGTGVVQNGCNSLAVIDGTLVERNSNSYTIDGKSYELTELSDTSEQYINFTVSKDYSATVDTVSKFVEGLNKLIKKLDDYVNAEDNSYDYPPLTEAQKEEMSDDEIEKWEEKAKTGILNNNTAIERLLSDLKQAFFTSAGGTGSAAASIGLSTGNYFTSDKGSLTLDTDKLKEALAKDPEKVVSIFTGGSLKASSSEQGVIYKIMNSVSSFKKLASDSISNTEDSIDKVDDSIDKLEDKLDSLAEKYYKEFSAMETALAKMNSQASYLSQLFS
jgi:flagellar hook-associated protein 2